MTRKTDIQFFFLILFSILGFGTLFIETYNLGLFSSFITSILLTKRIRNSFGINSLVYFFQLVSILYLYSLPISVVLGLDVGAYRIDYVSTWNQVDKSLCLFSFLAHIFEVTFVIFYFRFKRYINVKQEIFPSKFSYTDKIIYLNSSFITAVLALIFQAINFFRVGGISKLIEGKLLYQSALLKTHFILPAELFFYISIILFAQIIAHTEYKISKKIKILFLIILSPIISLNLFIGERGLILTAILVFIASFFYKKRITKIPFRLIWIGGIAYIFFTFLTVYRGVFDSGYNSYSSPIAYIEENNDKIIFLLNPANSEFATSALNFRKFYTQRSPYEPMHDQFGLSYLHFYTQLLPQRINPFYDLSNTIKFRNKYFPERGESGASGGTAYSALMESYMNFGIIGSWIPFAIFIGFIFKLEKYRLKRKLNAFNLLFYGFMFDIALLFHRSASDYVIYRLISILILSILIYITFSIVKKTS